MSYFETRNKDLVKQLVDQSGLPIDYVKGLVESFLAHHDKPLQKQPKLLRLTSISEQINLNPKADAAVNDIKRTLINIREFDIQLKSLITFLGLAPKLTAQIWNRVLVALFEAGALNPIDCAVIIRGAFSVLPKNNAKDLLLYTDLTDLLQKIQFAEYSIEYLAGLFSLAKFQDICKQAAKHLDITEKKLLSMGITPPPFAAITQVALAGDKPFAVEILNLLGDASCPIDFPKLCREFLQVALRHATIGEIDTFLHDYEAEPNKEALAAKSLFGIPYADFTKYPQNTPLGELFSFLLEIGAIALHTKGASKVKQSGHEETLALLKKTKSLGKGGSGYFGLISSGLCLKDINVFLDNAKANFKALFHLKAEVKRVVRGELIARNQSVFKANPLAPPQGLKPAAITVKAGSKKRKKPFDQISASLVSHHKLEGDSILEFEPITCTSLASRSKTSKATVSRFFTYYFQSHRIYRQSCMFPKNLRRYLKIINNELTPRVLWNALAKAESLEDPRKPPDPD